MLAKGYLFFIILVNAFLASNLLASEVSLKMNALDQHKVTKVKVLCFHDIDGKGKYSISSKDLRKNTQKGSQLSKLKQTSPPTKQKTPTCLKL